MNFVGGRGREIGEAARKRRTKKRAGSRGPWRSRGRRRLGSRREREKGRIWSAAIPRVTSSTYFQVNDNYYPGWTRAAVWPPQSSQIIALFIWLWGAGARPARPRSLVSENARLLVEITRNVRDCTTVVRWLLKRTVFEG